MSNGDDIRNLYVLYNIFFLILNLKNYCYFRYGNIILLRFIAFADFIYVLYYYIAYGIGMIILTFYNQIEEQYMEIIPFTFIFILGILKFF